MARTLNRIFSILAIIYLLTFASPVTAHAEGLFGLIKSRLFPTIEVTLANDGDFPVFYMCKFTDKDNYLHVLGKGEIYRYNFTQIAFPMRWCYLYINEKTHGFFWAYNVRLRCTKCFWSITNYPNLYRSDRSRWERQKLYVPLDFNMSEYLVKDNSQQFLNDFGL